MCIRDKYYEYVSQDQEAVLQLAKEAESSYNRYIRTKSGDYFKVCLLYTSRCV